MMPACQQAGNSIGRGWRCSPRATRPTRRRGRAARPASSPACARPEPSRSASTPAPARRRGLSRLLRVRWQREAASPVFAGASGGLGEAAIRSARAARRRRHDRQQLPAQDPAADGHLRGRNRRPGAAPGGLRTRRAQREADLALARAAAADLPAQPRLLRRAPSGPRNRSATTTAIDPAQGPRGRLRAKLRADAGRARLERAALPLPRRRLGAEAGPRRARGLRRGPPASPGGDPRRRRQPPAPRRRGGNRARAALPLLPRGPRPARGAPAPGDLPGRALQPRGFRNRLRRRRRRRGCRASAPRSAGRRARSATAGGVVPPGDREALVAAMLRALRPATPRSGLGGLALERSPLFTWDAVAERVLPSTATAGRRDRGPGRVHRARRRASSNWSRSLRSAR